MRHGCWEENVGAQLYYELPGPLLVLPETRYCIGPIGYRTRSQGRQALLCCGVTALGQVAPKLGT